MKDSEAREVIKLLTERIKDLEKDVQMLQHPHLKDCECDYCQGFTPDHSSIMFERGYARWWEP